MQVGPYTIQGELGHGGMGTVYRACDTRSGTVVAIKELAIRHSEDAQIALKQFEQEARLLSRLSHPRLVRLIQYLEQDGLPYLVMEYIEGRTLQAEIIDLKRPWPYQRTIELFRQMCDVLEYLHRQNPPVILRDLKPGNLIVRGSDVYVIDLGIARSLGKGSRTTTVLRGMGSVGFAALEQYGGGTDQRTDAYALGATLYTMLTLTVPPGSLERFAGSAHLDPPSLRNGAIPLSLDRVVLKMMALRQPDRYDSVAAARVDVERVLQGSGVNPLRARLRLISASHVSETPLKTSTRVRTEQDPISILLKTPFVPRSVVDFVEEAMASGTSSPEWCFLASSGRSLIGVAMFVRGIESDAAHLRVLRVSPYAERSDTLLRALIGEGGAALMRAGVHSTEYALAEIDTHMQDVLVSLGYRPLQRLIHCFGALAFDAAREPVPWIFSPQSAPTRTVEILQSALAVSQDHRIQETVRRLGAELAASNYLEALQPIYDAELWFLIDAGREGQGIVVCQQQDEQTVIHLVEGTFLSNPSLRFECLADIFRRLAKRGIHRVIARLDEACIETLETLGQLGFEAFDTSRLMYKIR